MSLFWLLMYAFLIFVAITGYLIYTEHKEYQRCWPYPSSHEEMVAIAKKKKDSQMNDEEFNIKYAAFRHEIMRFAAFDKKWLSLFNYIFHYIELYLLRGGPQRLRANYPIKEPIFIIGDFRSGTSVLERLIAHHPDVAYFRMTHQMVWAGPFLWNKFLAPMAFIRDELLGHKAWNKPGSKGMFWPHSSNVLLHRDRPFEIENLWQSCSRNLWTRRCDTWQILDDVEKNPDNSTDFDLLDENFSDPAFEELFLNSIRLILACSKSKQPRFILKNPLNGYRLGFLHKLFPDAKFVHIARNPLKTTLSQIEMAQSNLRAFGMDEMQCRKNDNKPPKVDPAKTKVSWNYIFNNKYPNGETGTLWFPRQFPRTVPEYGKITKYIKQEKYECAVAVAVTQQERVTLDGFKKIGAVEGKNKFTVWHEDILQDASKTFEVVMRYLGLECTAKQRLQWLEMEDFPNGQANMKRVSKSNLHEKKNAIKFGEWTKETTEIIENDPVMKRYKERKSVSERFPDDVDTVTVGNGIHS